MHRFGGRDFLAASRLAFVSLTNHEDELNHLNVFPVPDGDTGLNMSRTMAPVLSVKSSPDLSKISSEVALAVLEASRGNSGTILATFFLGLSKAFANKKSVDSAHLIAAFKAGAEESYASLVDPAEGTILTVMRDCASVPPASSIEETLMAMQKAAFVSLKNTPNLMPLLKETGLIDAGGLGFYYLVEAFRDASLGKTVEENADLSPLIKERKGEENDLRYRFCVEGLLKKSEAYHGIDKASVLKEQLKGMGGSLVYVETESLIKFHIHANEDEPVKDVMSRFGSLLDYKVDNMARQIHNERFHHASVAFVSVIDSDDFAAIYSNFEVPEAFIAPLSREVSYEEIAQAVEILDAENIVLLPNDKNAITTCELFAKRSPRHISTLPSGSEMEGVVALEHFDPEADFESNLKAMNQALEETDFFAIVQAVKNYAHGALNVQTGDFVLVKDGLLLASSKEPSGLLPVLFSLLDDKCEFTIYAGVSAPESEAAFLAEEIRKRLSSSDDVISLRGNEKIARYLISGEKA
ncbi:MAG: DAK2 domain-containing protein [Bacilli bacterium]